VSAITIPNLLRAVPALVGGRPDKRWFRASLTLKGSDGESREAFFNRGVDERIAAVHERIVARAAWKPLLQLDIGKKHAANKTRPICWATIADTALLYLLADVLSAHAETVLTDVCIAYRPHRALDRSIRQVVQTMRRRGLYCVCVVDIESFFDSISWKGLDVVVDGLPAAPDVTTLLKTLIRGRILRKGDGTVVDRKRGIPQGLQVSPVLANLVLADFDKRVQMRLARLGATVVRYADDILIAAPTMASLESGRRFVTTQLHWEALSVKEGTGGCIDLRLQGARARWLGIELATSAIGNQRGLVLDMPESSISEKAEDLVRELRGGVISMEEVDDRLRGLERFLGGVLSDQKTKQAIRSVRERIVTSQRLFQNIHTPGRRGRNTEVTRTIQEVIFPSHPLMKNNMTHTPGHELDEGSGNRGSLHPPSRVELIGVTSTECHSLPSPLAMAGRGDGAGLVDGDWDELSARTAGSTPASRRFNEWSLQPPGGLRPDNPAGRSGAPARLRPERHLENQPVVVRVKARGTRAAQLDVFGASSWSEVLAVPDSLSTAESVLAAFEHAIRRLTAQGHSSFVLLTAEPTISGYVHRGWRVGSVRVLRRLRGINFSAWASRIVFDEDAGEKRKPRRCKGA
jgi:retron-type reverse transcriptase